MLLLRLRNYIVADTGGHDDMGVSENKGPCIRPLIFGMINTTMTMVVFVMVVSTLTMRMVVLTTVKLI